jgi:hypothetical protein
MKAFFDGVGEFFKGLGNTLVALAQSRKVFVATVSQLLNVGVTLVPALAAYQDRIVAGIDLAMVAIVLGIALEDAAAKHAAQIVAQPDIQQSLQEASDDLGKISGG